MEVVKIYKILKIEKEKILVVIMYTHWQVPNVEKKTSFIYEVLLD